MRFLVAAWELVPWSAAFFAALAFVFFGDDLAVLDAFELFVAAIAMGEDGRDDGDEGQAKVGVYCCQCSCIERKVKVRTPNLRTAR